MLGRRHLLHAGLLILLTLPPVAVGGAVRVLSPTDQDILIGETRFAFEIVDLAAGVDRIDIYVTGRLIGSAQAPEWTLTWEAPTDLRDPRAAAVAYAGDNVIQRMALKTRVVTIGERVEVSLVQLYPVVLDGRGRYAHGLVESDFVVRDQGHPIEIQRFGVGTTRSSVTMVVDTSQSMTSKLPVVQDACTRFVTRLQDRHALSLYAFNQTLLPIVETTSDSTAVEAAIRTLRAGGGTALYDAMLDVLGRLDKIDGRRVVVVFSDGKDERSIVSRQAVISAARESGVLVYSVGTLSGEAGSSQRDDLQQLADETGGQAFFIKKAADLHGVFDDIVQDLEAQYVLSYPVPDGPTGLREVEVRARNRNLRVRCRDQYFVEP